MTAAHFPPFIGTRFATLIAGLVATLLAVAVSAQASEHPATIAVASSLLSWAQEQQRQFRRDQGHAVVLASGSTGKHYAQILHGAPFDAWLAADAVRPEELRSRGIGTKAPRTFALGRLVFWRPRASTSSLDWLSQPANNRQLAIANPALAPYGLAAQQTLQTLQLWPAWQSRLVRGENVAQAMQFVISGHAEAGLIALSLLQRPGHKIPQEAVLIPEAWHAPIRHQALLLRNHSAASAFLDYLMQPAAQASLPTFGLQPIAGPIHDE